MFTGIIEEIGILLKVERKGEFLSLEIGASEVTNGTRPGDSIAVNGVCLTATRVSEKAFSADVMQETYQRSNLKNLRSGAHVNLERALSLNSRLGGHMVAGHVDAVGTIITKRFDNNTHFFGIRVPEELMKFIVPKGSVAVDGISLTVVNVRENSCTVGIIPHTMEHTTLHLLQIGDTVNIEVDMIARYIVQYLDKTQGNSNIDWERIAKEGL